MNPDKNLILLSVILLITFMIYAEQTNHVFGDVTVITPSYTSINISGTPNTNDFPYGICSDGTYRYMTLFSHGSLVKILISDNSYTIYDNNAVASGEDWYSCVVASGKVYINEKDTGLVRVFNISTNTYGTSIPLEANIDDSELDYIDGYTVKPNKLRAVDSNNTYEFGCGSFGELKFTNSYVWAVFDCVFDFSATDNANGVVDYSFHGVVRINPTDNSVTRYAISGATGLRGISVDVNDSTILWITDRDSGKLYRFNTNTGLVTDTVTLPANTNAMGVANDSTAVFIAENDDGGTGVTSKILKVQKSGFSTSQIDTDASVPNGKTGTFSVYVSNGLLIWTDRANHVGTIQINNVNVKTLGTTTGTTDSNHFGIVEGSNFVFAGKGSVVQASIQLGSTSESSHGDSCAGDCYSPHFGNDENGKEFYKDGLTIIGGNFKKIINIENVLHVLSNETINLPIGQPINFTLKAMDSYPNQIKSCEIALGIQRGNFVKQDAQFILGVKRTFDGIVSIYEEGNKKAYRDFNAEMENQDQFVFCKFMFTPTYHLQKDMFAIQAVDIHQYDGIYFVNEGIFFRGISEIGTPVFDYMDDRGRIHVLTIVDSTLENTSLTIDENGEYWYIEDGFWFKNFIMPDMTGSISEFNGFDRNDYWEFKAYKLGQELLAKQSWDSSKIQKIVKPAKTTEIVSYPRGHDPVPNMMKAIGELALLNEGKR
jgi:hypothetical protein